MERRSGKNGMAGAAISLARVRARLPWLILLLLAQALYLPINRVVRGGVILDTPWDAAIPLWPIWAVPYLLSLGVALGCELWATVAMETRCYRAFLAAMLMAIVVSYGIYLVFPTAVERPSLQGEGWRIALMRFVYSSDRPYNAFPSSHTYTAALIGLFWYRWRPRLWWLWLGIVTVVLLSTLFTRQHNLPDLAGGIALALIGYHSGLWWARAREGKQR